MRVEINIHEPGFVFREFAFDPNWYRDFYGFEPGIDAAALHRHFLKKGLARGHQPSPFFNPAYVRRELFLAGVGLSEAAQDDPDQIVREYIRHSDKVNPHPLLPRRSVGALGVTKKMKNLETEWLNFGILALRWFDSQEVRFSPFFDPGFVLDKDGKPAEKPLATYLRKLANTETKVSVLFDAEFYAAQYPDIARAVSEGSAAVPSLLQHFITFGMAENRLPIADFDPDFYLAAHPDLAEGLSKGGMTPVAHFMQYGIWEGRDPNPFFNSRYYLDHQPHVAEEIRKLRLYGAFEHFLKIGYKAGFRVNQPLYDIPVPENLAKGLYEKRCWRDVNELARSGKPIVLPDPTDAPDISCIVPVVNQGHMTVRLLKQLADIAWRRDMPKIEVIVVDNGSTDLTTRLAEMTEGAVILRSDTPLGYPGACNRGAAVARGRVLVFMNNDIEVNAESFRSGLARLDSDAGIGAVGGRILLMNGTLQEAGCLVFGDGGTLGVGRGKDPDLPEFAVPRQVDFCSGCFLFVRRSDFQALNGFDEVFSPGYFEESDLCLRLADRGLRTIYDPAVKVDHYEYASYSKGRPPTVSAAIMKRNKKIFLDRHRKRLSALPIGDGIGWRQRWFRARCDDRLSIAVVEDMLPAQKIGSGFVRSRDLIDSLLKAGHRVTIFALHYYPGADAQAWRERGARVVECFRLPPGSNPLEGQDWSFDVLWISRTHNIRRWTQLALPLRSVNPDLRVVFDTEALASLREISYRQIGGLRAVKDPDELVAQELEGSLTPDAVVVVNDRDRRAVERLGLSRVFDLGLLSAPVANPPGPQGRRGLFFCGAFHDEQSPNFDSMHWFLTEVWPLIRKARPEETFTIAGYTAAGVPLDDLVKDRPGVEYVGAVDRLDDWFDGARGFVAPTRYAGGMPQKVTEALAAGLPVVCTDLLREQLVEGGTDFASVPVLSAGVTDAAGFAAACIALLDGSDDAWKERQQAGLEFIRKIASLDVFDAKVKEIVDGLR